MTCVGDKEDIASGGLSRIDNGNLHGKEGGSLPADKEGGDADLPEAGSRLLVNVSSGKGIGLIFAGALESDAAVGLVLMEGVLDEELKDLGIPWFIVGVFLERLPDSIPIYYCRLGGVKRERRGCGRETNLDGQLMRFFSVMATTWSRFLEK
jgi:hypothetical protein